ncbi:MAG: 50S ribosomal protein L24 [Deltaproteobacteria bacterium]|nr:MAG: 50S ribosomal protein L24 [Deltaproteobacteria bacterium]
MKRIKKGDTVRVIAGKERGKEGTVLAFSHKGKRALVEKLNMVKRHTRPTATNQAGGIIEKEAGIDLSNLMPLTPSGKPTRVQFRVNEDGDKVRYSKKYDEYLD